jgi:hypothetical protein
MEGVFDRKGCHEFTVSQYYLGIPELRTSGCGKIIYFVILSEAKNLSSVFANKEKEREILRFAQNDKILRPCESRDVRRATNAAAYTSFSISALNSAVTP